MKGNRMTPLRLGSAKDDKRGVSPIIATILLVAITVVLAAVLYVLVSGYITGGSTAPSTVGLSSTGSGTLSAAMPTTVATQWGSYEGAGAFGTQCAAANPCQTDNFTLSASSGLTTASFGFKITTTTGATVTGWIIVLWNAQGTEPLAAYNQGYGNWSIAHSESPAIALPIGGLQDDGIMLICQGGSAHNLIGTGDSLQAFGTGSGSVSGHTTL